MENADDRLIPFLRNLADSIERRQLAPRQIQSVGEFFMNYQFQEQAVRDQDTSSPPPRQFSQEELIKFLVLGWYIYCILLNGETIRSPVDELLD